MLPDRSPRGLPDTQAVGVERAKIDDLLGRSFAAERLIAIGYGPNQPVESNDTATGRALNRRVHLKASN